MRSRRRLAAPLTRVRPDMKTLRWELITSPHTTSWPKVADFISQEAGKRRAHHVSRGEHTIDNCYLRIYGVMCWLQFWGLLPLPWRVPGTACGWQGKGRGPLDWQTGRRRSAWSISGGALKGPPRSTYENGLEYSLDDLISADWTWKIQYVSFFQIWSTHICISKHKVAYSFSLRILDASGAGSRSKQLNCVLHSQDPRVAWAAGISSFSLASSLISVLSSCPGSKALSLSWQQAMLPKQLAAADWPISFHYPYMSMSLRILTKSQWLSMWSCVNVGM